MDLWPSSILFVLVTAASTYLVEGGYKGSAFGEGLLFAARDLIDEAHLQGLLGGEELTLVQGPLHNPAGQDALVRVHHPPGDDKTEAGGMDSNEAIGEHYPVLAGGGQDAPGGRSMTLKGGLFFA